MGKMTTRSVFKIGSSFAIVIPAEFVQFNHIRNKERVCIQDLGDRLLISKASRYAELLDMEYLDGADTFRKAINRNKSKIKQGINALNRKVKQDGAGNIIELADGAD